MHTHAFAEYMECIDRDDWSGVGALMLSSAEKLVRSGARLLVCPDNTIHQAIPLIAGHLPAPFLHIADCVADEAVARGFRKLGLTGTRWLVNSDVYPSKFAARGLACVRPQPDEILHINRIIMDELVLGLFRPEAVAEFQNVIRRMQVAGCDAVVLGCTEIPLIITDANAPLPTLDSTRLLARAALRYVMT